MINEGLFPEHWKKSHVVPIHKKESKNVIKNYRPISHLPIFIKVFEKVDFNTLLNFFLHNKLFTPCQSGFISGHSCVSKLLSIKPEIYKSFDCHPPTDMRGTFLDISKAFGKVWQEGLIFKFKTYGVDDDLLSSWQNIYAGLLQGSVLWTLLPLIYVNELPDGLTSMCNIFADGTSLFSKVIDKNNSNSQLNYNLAKISKWVFQWKMSFNPDPNKQATEVCFSNKRGKENYLPLRFNSADS